MDEHLLTQNAELKKDGIFCWTIPALRVQLSNGKWFATCPKAGVCGDLCYARAGTYMIPSTIDAHRRKLEMVLDDPIAWEVAMIRELRDDRYRGGKYVRIHDAGDFFALWYAMAWVRIAEAHPDVTFYAYTKEVRMFKEHLMPLPDNFKIVFSMGGQEDAYIDKDVDRHAEVFPDFESMRAAGYDDQEDNDIMAITNPNHRVGVVSNNQPALLVKQGYNTFGTLQQIKDAKRAVSRGQADQDVVDDLLLGPLLEGS